MAALWQNNIIIIISWHIAGGVSMALCMVYKKKTISTTVWQQHKRQSAIVNNLNNNIYCVATSIWKHVAEAMTNHIKRGPEVDINEMKEMK